MALRTHYPYVDRLNPEAAGVCDRGGEVRRLSDLKPEMVWRGNRLVWNGFLVCDHHRDPPHPYDRLQVLPSPDPAPVRNPRPLQPMIPLPGFVTDGIPDADTTQDYVTDSSGAPILDHPGTKYPE